MNQKQRKFWYPNIVKAQGGEFCKGCGIKREDTEEDKLMIDHIDNIPNHNIILNLQLLCRACNRLKNPHKVENYHRPMTPEMIRQTKGEPKFRNWLFRQITDNHFINKDEAIAGGAEYSSMSLEAIKGYVRKCTSKEGIYSLTYDQDGEEIIIFKGDERTVEDEIEHTKSYRTIP